MKTKLTVTFSGQLHHVEATNASPDYKVVICVTTQQTHYAIMTLLLRQNDVILALLRQNNMALRL